MIHFFFCVSAFSRVAPKLQLQFSIEFSKISILNENANVRHGEMNIEQLTKKMNDLVSEKGWGGENSRRPQTPRNIACSLSIEASEVLEHFQWSDDCENPEELAGELADVTLYLLQLAHLTGINLEKAILDKLALNYTRV